ncbi:MAG TPA: hypothetical protein VKE98_23215, partial [Gemmataceae bacterium]|nr:hypothetical protein [Gemmataceae bacterium]
MHIKLKITATVFLLAVAGLRPVSAGEKGAPKDAPPASAKASAAERGLAFLVQDALKWQKERKCASCHHGTMTVWVLSEAKSRGYATDTLTDMVKWNKERLQDIDKARDKRAGWSMVNTPAVFLSTMAQAIPAQDAVSAEELKKIAGHLVQHQESDGSWAWSLAPAKNRPPPVFESDEVVTLMAYMALGPHASAKSTEKSDAALAREKAAAWLAKIKPSETSTQANALRLLR